jgi:transposase
MANKPIKMSKLRQVFKLHCQGQSKLYISTVTGLSRNTVSKYINNFIALKSTWEETNALSDKDLDDLFCKSPEVIPSDKLSRLHRFFSESSKRLGQCGVNRIYLWVEYKTKDPEGYGRTGFYRHYDNWKRRGQASMHIEHKAGDKMFIDFAGEKLKIVDPDTGEIKPSEVFVAILGASQLLYVEAVESQRVEDFISCCENALHYFGGAPSAIVPDNLKSAVTKSSRYEPRLNENFEAFADHYGMSVLPARAYKPKDKALVEGAVKITYGSVYAYLPSEPLTSLEELNFHIKSLFEKKNNIAFKGTQYSRRERFEEMERQALQPLPESRFELRHSSILTVMKNGHVCLSQDKHYYSVPFGYICKKVKMLYSKSTIEIFYKYERIASHKRIRSPHNYSTDPSHLATQHKVLSEWNPDYFLQQARSIDISVEFYISQVLLRKKHPEQGYKACQGILSYAKRVGHQRLINACARAHAYGLYNFKVIENIINKGLDLYDTEQEPQLNMPEHENIRGEKYYK